MKRIVAVAAAAIFASSLVAAHDQGVEGPVEARHAIMKYLGSQMRSLGMMAQGASEFDSSHAKSVGGAMHAMALSIPYLFIDESRWMEGTKASPAIFSDWDGFTAEASKLGDAAAKVAAATSAGDLSAAFRDLSGTCQSCHSQFRLR